jgi:hypothetical protein
MKLWISFPEGSFQGPGHALEFIYPFIRMPIESIMSGRSFDGGYETFRYEEAIARLNENQDRSFLLSAETTEPLGEENHISYHRESSKHTEYFVLALDAEILVDSAGLMQEADNRGMSFAYKFDFWKAYWQSVDLINTYQYNKRPYAHLKRLIEPNVLPILAKIDISENPGHQRLTYSMQLMAAPEMWFGSGCWKYFDRERVAGFPDAEEIRWLSAGLLYVRLFDWTTPDYEDPKILALQKKFREWTGMDQVERELEELSKAPRPAPGK